jgi:hypothetical protein
MATTTTNFGWDIPQSTDLVKDGATAIAALGQDIDTALVDLKGGTTGQVLAKASGSDLDFSWVAQDDSNAIQNAIVDAKGDLIAATAADTPARLAVGTNGQLLQADSTTATGLKWATISTTSGLTLVASTSISAATSISVNNCFTSTYANYLIVVDVPTTTGTAGYTTLRLRASGTDTTTGYGVQNLTAVGTSVSGARGTVWEPFYAYPTDPGFAGTIELFRPNMAEKTTFKCFTGYGSDEELFLRYGQQSSSTQFDGFTLTGPTTLTGTIRVYGYQNS